MKKIKLTQGKVALVDNRDYEYLNQWKWCAHRGSKTFYARRSINKDGKWTTISMHQVLAELMDFEYRADHINRNGLDNQRKNLRDATSKQNNENSRIRKDNTSKYKGVSWYKRKSKWQVQIRHYGKQIHLGLFDRLKDAVKARKKAEEKYFTHA